MRAISSSARCLSPSEILALAARAHQNAYSARRNFAAGPSFGIMQRGLSSAASLEARGGRVDSRSWRASRGLTTLTRASSLLRTSGESWFSQSFLGRRLQELVQGFPALKHLQFASQQIFWHPQHFLATSFFPGLGGGLGLGSVLAVSLEPELVEPDEEVEEDSSSDEDQLELLEPDWEVAENSEPDGEVAEMFSPGDGSDEDLEDSSSSAEGTPP